jgi:Cu/Ag efflux pump CusA
MAEELLLSVPEIETTGRKTGRAELDEHALGINESEIEAPFTLGKRTKEEVIAEVREKLNRLPGVNVEIGQPISHRIDAMLSGTQAYIAIKLFGTDLNRMFELGNRIKTGIDGIEGITPSSALSRYSGSLPAMGCCSSLGTTTWRGRAIQNVKAS